ncbi:MAG: hypothetical protein EPN85_08155, partial [Bacteroidetes bacterium]
MKKQTKSPCQLSKMEGSKTISMAVFALLAFFLIAPSLLQILPIGKDLGWASCVAQGNWAQKADFAGINRHNAVGFSIGQKGYIGTGRPYNIMPAYNDFWEWDKATNVWTQKADFAGAARAYAVGFSIGTKGYIGTGWDGVFGSYYQDFWEWNQATNTWIQRANFPPGARYDAVGFSMGTKGYIGTGYLPYAAYQDFWEWNQATNTWIQKANFAGGDRKRAVGFSIGAKGYIGTGADDLALISSFKKDFWEWDPASNVWTQKADFPGTAREDAVGFSMLTTYGAGGFIGTGSDLNNTSLKDFWEWNPGTNTWTQRASFGAGPRKWAVGFSIDSMGYIGTGGEHLPNNNKIIYDDFWEYCPNCPPPCVLTAAVSNPGTVCIGNNASISASGGTNYSWSTGATSATITVNQSVVTTYTVIVSDANGCSDTVTVTVPVKNCCAATAVISSDPSSTVCVGQQVFISASGGTTYSWNTGVTTANIVAAPSITTTYSVAITDAAGCTGIGTLTVPVDPNCSATGIAPLNTDALQIDIWPNPSNGEFRIGDLGLGIYNLDLYNVFGEKVHSGKILNPESQILNL